MSRSLSAARRRGNRRASSRFAGDMRACCGAPAARGSPPRPASLVRRDVFGLHVERREVIFYSRDRLSGTVHRLNKGKPFSHSTARDDVPLAKQEQRFCLVDVSAAGRGGDRRPERGGSSDAGRTLAPRLSGAAGVRTPAAVRQRGGRGTLSARGSRVKDGCPNAGFGVVGGKGLRKPLPPAARRAGDHTRMPG